MTSLENPHNTRMISFNVVCHFNPSHSLVARNVDIWNDKKPIMSSPVLKKRQTSESLKITFRVR